MFYSLVLLQLTSVYHKFFIAERVYIHRSFSFKSQEHKVKLFPSELINAHLLAHSHVHIIPLLLNLHWLPVPYPFKLKILLLTHKALHNQAPFYLKDLLPYHPPHL